MKQILALALAELVTRAPLLALDLWQLLAKESATNADWDALRVKWQKTWEQKKAEAETRAPLL
jgi:hypothetical protein